MRKLTTIILGLLLTTNTFASGLSCTLVDNFDDWSIQINEQQAAFFDNDHWATASYAYSIETNPTISVYESDDQDDQFTIKVQEFANNKIKASITVDMADGVETFALKCKKVKTLSYLD